MPPRKGDLPLRYFVPFVCAQCGKEGRKMLGAVNRAKKGGYRLYCDRVCLGLGRRSPVQLTADEKKALKSAYDAQYRERTRDQKLARAKAYYQANRTTILAQMAEYRKIRMPAHVEYCRRPEYKAYKQTYDKHYRARLCFGPFAEAALLLNEIETEISARISRTDIYAINGTLNKSTQRKRDYARTHRYQPQIGTLGNPQLDQDRRHATGSGRRGGGSGAGNPADRQDAASGFDPGQASDPSRTHQLHREVTTGASAPTLSAEEQS